VLIAVATVLAAPILSIPIAGAVVAHPALPVRNASAAYGNGQTNPSEQTQAVTDPRATTPSTAAAHHSSGGLPFTGGDVLGLTFIGIGLVLMGTAFSGGPRRRPVPTADLDD
jgi:hypothetical protein